MSEAVLPLPGRLPEPQRPLVSKWIVDLAQLAMEHDPDGLFDDLDDLIEGNGEVIQAQPEPVVHTVRQWWRLADEEELLALFSRVLRELGKDRKLPRATPEQVQIILETQTEVGIRFREGELQRLTSWQADVLIKGLIVISEVQRITGSRQLSIRQLRAAVRGLLTETAVYGPNRGRGRSTPAKGQSRK